MFICLESWNGRALFKKTTTTNKTKHIRLSAQEFEFQILPLTVTTQHLDSWKVSLLIYAWCDGPLSQRVPESLGRGRGRHTTRHLVGLQISHSLENPSEEAWSLWISRCICWAGRAHSGGELPLEDTELAGKLEKELDCWKPGCLPEPVTSPCWLNCGTACVITTRACGRAFQGTAVLWRSWSRPRLRGKNFISMLWSGHPVILGPATDRQQSPPGVPNNAGF